MPCWWARYRVCVPLLGWFRGIQISARDISMHHVRLCLLGTAEIMFFCPLLSVHVLVLPCWHRKGLFFGFLGFFSILCVGNQSRDNMKDFPKAVQDTCNGVQFPRSRYPRTIHIFCLFLPGALLCLQPRRDNIASVMFGCSHSSTEVLHSSKNICLSALSNSELTTLRW